MSSLFTALADSSNVLIAALLPLSLIQSNAAFAARE